MLYHQQIQIYTQEIQIHSSQPTKKLKFYEEYEKYKRNTIKVIQTCFDEYLLNNVESDGILIHYLPMEVYEHI